MTSREFFLNSEYITLGQLLKALNLVGSGGEVKEMLYDGGLKVNGEWEDRRGKKLRAGDTVLLLDGTLVQISEKAN